MLPLTPFERIAKKNNVKRISKDALEEARDIITEIANEISDNAVRISRHAGRKTVMKEDMEFVVRKR